MDHDSWINGEQYLDINVDKNDLWSTCGTNLVSTSFKVFFLFLVYKISPFEILFGVLEEKTSHRNEFTFKPLAFGKPLVFTILINRYRHFSVPSASFESNLNVNT